MAPNLDPIRVSRPPVAQSSRWIVAEQRSEARGATAGKAVEDSVPRLGMATMYKAIASGAIFVGYGTAL